jgi:cytosine/adenosine deaminase-related metal-dependent hydrolase
MKRFSAQYVITNTGPVLKRAILNIDDNGTILSIEETSGELTEERSIEFYNGIIVPGFVNCHCHLELSHLKDKIHEGGGLGEFIEQIRNERESTSGNIESSALAADNEMFIRGVSLCADICNTTHTFELKKESRIRYLNFLEVFGIDPAKAHSRMDELEKLSSAAKIMNLDYATVPHSTYSMSVTLLRLLKMKSAQNKVTSIHFMETDDERHFIENHTGPIMNSYRRSGLVPAVLNTVESHVDAILNEITASGNLILVHNTFADRGTIKGVMQRKNLFWCVCPNSNNYIEKKIPPIDLLIEEGCEIVIGTDSLASNRQLDIFSELKTLQQNFPTLSIVDLIRWATINGSKALGMEDMFGKIEPGKNPGVLLLQNVDLQNMKLLPESFVTRLV